MPKRVDRNQPEIVAALRKVGCTVTPLHTVGDGCPDLLVGRAGRNYLLEVKDGEKSPSEQKLTPDQVDWHNIWQGQVQTVNSVDKALQSVGVTK